MKPIKLTEEEKSLIEEYKNFFNNTGGNDIVDLIEHDDISVRCNPLVAILHCSVYAQLQMLQALKSATLLRPSNTEKVEFPPATCGCDSHPVTWSRGKNEDWICSATLPGSVQAWGNGPTPEEALAILNANIVIAKQQLKESGNALPLPPTNQ